MPVERPVLPWVRVAADAPYFETEHGNSWTPIGHNDAITWPTLSTTATRVDNYFKTLERCGVTCLRLMLEYAQHDGHFLERPVGTFNPKVVRTWDRLFALAERYAVRLLLTPFDTFWMWKRWRRHPYRRIDSTPIRREQLLASPAARQALKARLGFVIDRWGHSGALFAWDLWNEIHPAYAENDAGWFDDFIEDIAGFVQEREMARHGRCHPRTVSAFGPILSHGFQSRELGSTTPDPRVAKAVFEHPRLDFATVHTYAHGTIDDPANTVDAAVAMGDLTRSAILAIPQPRPYFDSEHGPIHRFKDQRRVLPEPFDDEYFRHLQWAHCSSGGVGGGMRWPNRRPHRLTPGMHAAQHALSLMLPLLQWRRFRRRNLNAELMVSGGDVAAFGCGDTEQALLWLLRRSPLTAAGTLPRDLPHVPVRITVPGLAAGQYLIRAWDTEAGCVAARWEAAVLDGRLHLEVLMRKDVAVIVQPRTWPG
jgi:mannan endo-1,4-beta-mannosidase